MEIESKGEIEKHEVERDGTPGSKVNIRKKNMGQRPRGKEQVEDDGQYRSENRPGEH